jgi:hypothetical protein
LHDLRLGYPKYRTGFPFKYSIIRLWIDRAQKMKMLDGMYQAHQVVEAKCLQDHVTAKKTFG